MDMSEYSPENDCMHFLFTCIDMFSKYAWVHSLPSKSAINVSNAFGDILNEGRIPEEIQTD